MFKQLPTMISDLNKLGIALKSLSTMKIGTVGVNTANIEAYRTALKGLSVEQSVFALASEGATEEQIRQILVTNQATAEDVEAAMAKAGFTTATQALTQAEMVEVATKTGVSKATAEELLSKIGITATETGQIPVKKQVTFAMLEQAVANGTLTKSEASQITTMLGLNAAETTNIGITNVLTASFTKLWAVITAHPIATILTAIGAVAVGTIAYINKTNKEAEDALVKAHENAKQALEDTKSSLSDDKSELQSVNSELETTKERLKEISSIGTPTLTEQNELTKLSTANAQLEAQQTLLENNIKLKQRSAALDAKELLGTQVQMEYLNILDSSSIESHNESYTYKEHAKYQASNLKNAYNIYMKALRDGDTKKQALAQELIYASAGDSAVLTSELLEIVESFKYDDGTIIEGYEDLYSEYMGMIYNLQSLTSPDTFLEIAKSVTARTDIDYEKAISDAYKLAYEGNFDVTSLNQDFVKALADAGIDESTIDYIFSFKQQEYQLLVDKINSKYDSSKVQYTHWDGKGNMYHDYTKEESAKADVEKINQELSKYARESPIEFQLISSYDENFALLDKYIEEEKTKAENSAYYVGDYVKNAIQRIYSEAFNNETYISSLKDLSFSGILGTTDNDSSLNSRIEAFKDSIEDIQNDILTLQSATPKTLSGILLDMTSKYGVSFDSAKEFIDYLTNKQNSSKESILSTINDEIALLDSELDADTIQKLKSLKTQIMGMSDEVRMDAQLDVIDDALDTMQSYYSTLQDIITTYNDKGFITIDQMQSLLEMDDKYVACLITEEGQLKLNTSAYTAITKAKIDEARATATQEYETTMAQIKMEALQRQTETTKKTIGDSNSGFISKVLHLSSVFTSASITSSIFKKGLSKIQNVINSINGNEEIETSYIDDIAQQEIEEAEKAYNARMTLLDRAENALGNSTDEVMGYSNTSSSASETAETIDWIETRIERLTDALDKLKSKTENTYASWTSRNAALTSAISKTQQAISLQSQAYSKYMQKANSVGLSSYYKNLVQNGSLSISTITNEDLSDKISEYQQWYDKAQECLQTQEDLNAELNELKSQKFENIKSEYDAVINRLQSSYDLLESQITLLSSASGYNTLRGKQSTIITKLQSELSALQKALNSSGIKQYTEEWYNLVSEIDDINQQIVGAKEELSEINELQFDNLQKLFDYKADNLEHAYTMLENGISLLSTSSDYNSLRNSQKAIISNLQTERKELSALINSFNISKGSEEWYEMTANLNEIDESLNDAYAALQEIDSLQFDNINETFDFDITKLEHGLQMIQNEVDLLELKGLFANANYYNGMIEYTRKELETLTKERTQLQTILNNTIYQQGTSEWNDMYSTLMDIDEEIDSMTSSLVEYNNAIRDLNWEVFGYLEESINRITDETDYLVELLSKKDLYDENGNLTKYSDATLGLLATAYDTYKQQAQDYYEEVQELQRQLVNGAGQDVLEQYNEMVDAHQDAVLAAEEEKQAILDLIEDGYNAQLDAIQALIDKKKEALSAEKDLYTYQKSISEKTANIASLEKQQLAYEGDTSEEAMSKIQQIKVSLEEAKADLAETEYEQYLSDTETMLDQLAGDYEEWMNARLDNEDALLAEIVSAVSVKGDEINATLSEVAKEYGTFISDTIVSVFDADAPFTSALTQGLTNVSDSIAGTTTAINNLVAQVAGIVNVNASLTNAESNVSGTVSSNVSGGSTGSSSSSGNSSNTTSSFSSSSSAGTKSTTSSASANSGSSSSTASKTTSSASTQGDGKLNVGDKATLKAGQSYYATSFGTGAKGSKYAGTTNGVVIDTKSIKSKVSGATNTASSYGNYYVHIKSADGKYADLGWVKPSQLSGYAKGTKRIFKDQLAWTQEKGNELLYDASNNAMLTPLGTGDMVFNSEASKILYEFSNDPEGYMKKLGIDYSSLSTMMSQPILDLTSSDFSNTGNQSSQMNVGDIHVNMDLSNITDYEGFRNQLIKDDTFEKAMFTSINHALTGKGTSLDKLKYAK